MNRRNGLSICFAVLASTAGAAAPATRATDYDNVHIRVLDPVKAAAWYVSALGATPSEPPAAGTAQVTFGSQVITITKGDTIQLHAPAGRPHQQADRHLADVSSAATRRRPTSPTLP